MVDNFDSNVARRKPNTTARRPVHPWDVPKIPPGDDTVDHREPENLPAPDVPVGGQDVSFPEPASDVLVSPPVPRAVKSSGGKRISPVVPVSTELTAEPPVEASPLGKSDLSDSINIHSNYCKLDNDISDFLLRKLSSSAQSVYLRLYRQSFGWNRNWAAESLPKLTEFCNLSLQTVRKAIKELELLGCIKKEFSDYHKATVYRVYLPSEIGMGKIAVSQNAPAHNRGQIINSLKLRDSSRESQSSPGVSSSGQNPDRSDSDIADYQFLEGNNAVSGGQNTVIQSVYFSGASIYSILESGGALPKNILTYMNETHIADAVASIDEFYDSIGFSVVSRSLYRRSLLDYFELIKSGFSADDIRYAIRWTFKNSRSRPESFSLIKHTMHLAMNDFIKDLKHVSGEKEVIREKQDALQKNLEWKNSAAARPVSAEDLHVWGQVMEDLRGNLNEHSFTAFIAPLRLDAVEESRIILSSPPDSVSWVNDHYVERIMGCYRERTGREVAVEIR